MPPLLAAHFPDKITLTTRKSYTHFIDFTERKGSGAKMATEKEVYDVQLLRSSFKRKRRI
jgi:hypothetical protein